MRPTESPVCSAGLEKNRDLFRSTHGAPDPALATPSIFRRLRLVELGETGLNWKRWVEGGGTVDDALGRWQTRNGSGDELP